jgi:hypothetical protein
MQSKHKRLNDTFYSDTMFSGVKSIQGNTCAQLFTNGKFVHLEPMARKAYEDLEKVQGSTLANKTILTMAEPCRRPNQGSTTLMKVDAAANEYPDETVGLRNGPYSKVNESNSTGTEWQHRP